MMAALLQQLCNSCASLAGFVLSFIACFFTCDRSLGEGKISHSTTATAGNYINSRHAYFRIEKQCRLLLRKTS